MFEYMNEQLTEIGVIPVIVIKDAKPDAVSHITPERHAAVARFCEDQLLAFFEDRFECGGDWDSVFDESNAGPWLTSIYMKFCSMHV